MAACLLGIFATTASATPASTSRCDSSSSGCHAAGSGATVVASLVSKSSTAATYNVAMTGSAGSVWAVFDGANRLAGGTAASGTFVVDLGKTYNVFAVNGSSPFSYATTSVSPAAPSVEPTVSLDETIPPVTTSDAKASYVGAAAVKLMASDGAGRGVAYIYYSVDGARVHLFTVGMVAQTSFTVPAPLIGTASHTIEFWSQDMAGNVEAHKSATFTVTAPPVLTVATTALSFKATPTTSYSGHKFVFTGKISPSSMASGTRITIWMRKSGQPWRKLGTVYSNGSDNYSYTLYNGSRAHGTYYVRAKYAGNSVYASSYSPYKKVYIK